MGRNESTLCGVNMRRRPATQFYDRAKELDEAVFRLCEHRHEDASCKRCPKEEHDATYG